MVTSSSPRAVLRPGIVAGIGIWMVYWLLTISIQLSSGIPYQDWFKTAANAWRTGVLSLAVGSFALLVLWRVLRWDHLWRDPTLLPTTRWMKAAMIFWWLAIGVRGFGIAWNEVPLDLLLAIIASGILVGFAEETLFRGFFLRGLREGGRTESSAAVWTAIAFGLFHLPNVFMGTGAIGLVQVVLAALSGSILYVFRRHFGTIWPAMLAHGMWDISTFLSTNYAQPWLQMANLVSLGLTVVFGIGVVVGLLQRDRASAL